MEAGKERRSEGGQGEGAGGRREFKPAFETSQTPYSDLAYLLSRSTHRSVVTNERTI